MTEPRTINDTLRDLENKAVRLHGLAQAASFLANEIETEKSPAAEGLLAVLDAMEGAAERLADDAGRATVSKGAAA